MGSTAGRLNKIKSQEILNRFKNPACTLEELEKLGKEFISSVADNTYESKGWPKTTYGVSKMLINTYPKVLA